MADQGSFPRETGANPEEELDKSPRGSIPMICVQDTKDIPPQTRDPKSHVKTTGEGNHLEPVLEGTGEEREALSEGGSIRGEAEGGSEEEGDEEEEEEEAEMNQEEKQAMFECVKAGDIDLLDDLLDLAGADINMTWFNESLLMAAIRHRQQEMAEFLLDNGVDQNYTASIMDKREEDDVIPKEVDWYSISCRQMAYENNMSDIVDLIDQMNGELWAFHKPRDREIRLKKPLEEKLKEQEERERLEREEEEARLREERGEDEEDGGRSSRQSAISRASRKSGSRPQTAETASKSLCADDKEKPNTSPTMLTSSGYDTLSSVNSAEFASLTELPPSTPCYGYRNNKAFFSRKLHNDAYRKCKENKGNDVTPRLQGIKPSHVSSMKLYLAEIDNLRSNNNSRASGPHDFDFARVVSPWRQDDPIYVSYLTKRSKSAPSSTPKATVTRPQAKTYPLQAEYSMHLPQLEDVLRNDSTLYPTALERRCWSRSRKVKGEMYTGASQCGFKPINRSSTVTSHIGIGHEHHGGHRLYKHSGLNVDRNETLTRQSCPSFFQNLTNSSCNTRALSHPAVVKSPRMQTFGNTVVREARRCSPAGRMKTTPHIKHLR